MPIGGEMNEDRFAALVKRWKDLSERNKADGDEYANRGDWPTSNRLRTVAQAQKNCAIDLEDVIAGKTLPGEEKE
jgi:hypothetical protein